MSSLGVNQQVSFLNETPFPHTPTQVQWPFRNTSYHRTPYANHMLAAASDWTMQGTGCLNQFSQPITPSAFSGVSQ